MSLTELLKRVDEQIAAKAAIKQRDPRQRERRTEAVPVTVDRRRDDRRKGDRRGKGRA
jgi:hypothetical protein